MLQQVDLKITPHASKEKLLFQAFTKNDLHIKEFVKPNIMWIDVARFNVQNLTIRTR